jgi:hypothetical protein
MILVSCLDMFHLAILFDRLPHLSDFPAACLRRQILAIAEKSGEDRRPASTSG